MNLVICCLVPTCLAGFFGAYARRELKLVTALGNDVTVARELVLVLLFVLLPRLLRMSNATLTHAHRQCCLQDFS